MNENEQALLITLLSFGLTLPLLWWSFGFMQRLRHPSRQVLIGLRDGDYASAYEALSQRTQESIGNAQQLGHLYQHAALQLQTWTLFDYKLDLMNRGNVQGLAKTDNGRRMIIRLRLRHAKNLGWQVEGLWLGKQRIF